MARRLPVRLLCAGAFVVLLTSCGGTGVDTAADTGAASAAGQDRTASSGDTATATTGGSDSEQGGGNPGGPGGSGDDAAGEGTDVEAGGNPGAPGDVAVFEEAGVPHSVLRDDAANKCAGGVCTLLEPVVSAGNPDDVGGVDECVIQSQSDIHYNPPAQGGFFQKGAKVQAHVDCTSTDEGTDGTGDTGGDGSQTSDSSTSDSGPSSDSSTSSSSSTSDTGDQPQG